jgi:putative endonuclease
MENRRKIGADYERQAEEYLQTCGYRILERNYRCRQGEIDLIAREGEALVFLEVKYRRTAAHGLPSEAVTPAKQRTICRVADYYRLTHGIPDNTPCRFDVVSILGQEITLYRNAFLYRQTGGRV